MQKYFYTQKYNIVPSERRDRTLCRITADNGLQWAAPSSQKRKGSLMPCPPSSEAHLSCTLTFVKLEDEYGLVFKMRCACAIAKYCLVPRILWNLKTHDRPVVEENLQKWATVAAATVRHTALGLLQSKESKSDISGIQRNDSYNPCGQGKDGPGMKRGNRNPSSIYK